MHRNKRLLGRGALILATLLWGSSVVLIDFTLDSVSPLYIIAIRFLGAAVILLIASFPKLNVIDRGCLASGALMGITLFFAHAFATFGLERTTPGKNAVLTASYCIIVPFLYWFLFNKRPDRYNVSAAAISLVGIGFISLDEQLSLGMGDGLTLIGGFFFAANIIATSKALESNTAIHLTTVQFAVTGIISCVFATIFEPTPKNIPMNTIWMLIFLVLVSTALCIFLQIYGQKYTPPSQSAIILSFEAVFGAAASVLFRNEVLTLRLTTGFFLMFIAVIISETKLNFLRHSKAKIRIRD